MRSLQTVFFAFALLIGCDNPTDSTATIDTSTDESASIIADPNDVDVSVDEPNNSRPVAVGVALDRSSAKPGDVVTLVVRSKIADPWHIYSSEGPTGVGRATQIDLTLPQGIDEHSERILPEAKIEESTLGPVASYHGDIRFAIPLKIDAQTPSGPVNLQVRFNYQACTDAQCLPPSSVSLDVPLEVVAR